jgi:hypothetical protein
MTLGNFDIFKAKTGDNCKLVVPFSTLSSIKNEGAGIGTVISSSWLAMTTFFIGYLLQRLESNSNCSVLRSFWRSTFLITVVFFHNGWLLLNFMPTYNTLLFIGLFATLSFLRSSKFNMPTHFAIKMDRGHR